MNNQDTSKEELEQSICKAFFKGKTTQELDLNQVEKFFDIRDIAMPLIQSEITKAQQQLLDELKLMVEAQIGASNINLKYSHDHNHSKSIIANWEGCIQGEKFILEDIEAKRKELELK